ncbi:hypothetical protein KA012_01205 [Candidatus Woesebacteria bacterium]|nr:hypothetical protein [Candidatus Woesebacteria bacterium]
MPVPAAKTTKSNSEFNLTKATEIGRIVVKFGGIILIAIMVGRMTLNGITAFWVATHPEPPPPPTQGFGAIPPVEFGNGGAEVQPKSYQLELPGPFPTFPDRAFVYLMPKGQIRLLSLEETKASAAKLGFLSAPVELDEQNYRWRRTGDLNASLEMNTVTKNFRYTTDYLSRPDLQLNNELPTTFDAVQTVKQFLGSADLLPADIATAAGETQFLKIAGGAVKAAVSLSDSQLIRVDLFRTPVDGIPTYTEDGKTGLVSATVASINRQPTVIEITRNYAPIEETIAYTYPLKTAQEAWQLMKSGVGFSASAYRSDEAVIRSVSLGYFESADSLYLQPIYVFTGDDDYIGYIDAISSSAQTVPDQP